MTVARVPTYPADIFTDEALRDPYGHYRALRELGSVVWLDAHQMYAIPRYDAARAALADPGTYCSGQGVALNDVFNGMAAGRNLIMTDGELHAHLRDVLGRNITPRALRHMEDAVESLATDLVGDLVRRGSFDAVSELARALPLKVVPDLVGWPQDRREHLLDWASATFDLLGPMNDRARRAVPTAQEMLGFAAEMASSGNFLEGSVGMGLIEAARQGELRPEQVAPLIVGYMAPSLDTTISAIGNLVWLLATHPDQWQKLRSDATLVPNAFDEALRMESPIRVFSRVTTRATVLEGSEVPEGARLMILYGAANRDERRFERPDHFMVDRANARDHLGFGYGVHGCAGQGLARMEAHALLRAMVAQVQRIELLEQPERSMNNLIHAWERLSVRVYPVDVAVRAQ